MIFPSYYDILYFGWNTDSSIYCAFTPNGLTEVAGTVMFSVRVNGFMGLNTLKGSIKKTLGSNAISDQKILNAFVDVVRRYVNSEIICVGYNKRTRRADILDTSDGVIEQYDIVKLLDIDKLFNLGIVSRVPEGIMLRRFDGKMALIKG